MLLHFSINRLRLVYRPIVHKVDRCCGVFAAVVYCLAFDQPQLPGNNRIKLWTGQCRPMASHVDILATTNVA